MYLKKISIKNIKSIKELEIEFDAPYHGWHVLLGDNGAGKSTILKAIALNLIAGYQVHTLKENFKSWITRDESKAKCDLELINRTENTIYSVMKISEDENIIYTFWQKNQPHLLSLPNLPPFFNASFGPFRRLGNLETKNLSQFSDGNLENHITLFDSNYNLTGAVEWLKEMKFQELENSISQEYFKNLLNFINNSGLLPNNVSIEKVSSKGVFFKDGNNKGISINELSDGYQSIFSLTIEILRQISNSFDLSEVLKNENGDFYVDAPGVILIDEVDIHLHPTWQAQIGEWFKKYFPKIQFIVTTHSPIICRSAEGASIWKIEHSKNEKPSHRIVGQDFKRMVYGNVLDAFGTDNFGEELVVRSEKSKEMLNKLAKLNMKSIKGLATESEKEELKELKSILPSQ